MAASTVETTVVRSSLPSTADSSAIQDSVGTMTEDSLQAVEQTEQVGLFYVLWYLRSKPSVGLACYSRLPFPSLNVCAACRDTAVAIVALLIENCSGTGNCVVTVVWFAQLLSSRARSATEGLIAAFGYLGEILGGVSHEVLRTHPFYRHAGRQQNLSGRSFSEEKAASSYVCHASAVPLLSECRRLLKKLRLTKEELEKLLDYTERLSGYASTHMPAHNRPSTTSYAVETLGRVFLILDTLYCAAEVLGDASKKDSWWPSIVHHIENARYRGGSSETVMRRPCWSSAILNALNVALDYFRIGRRPPLQLVVGLKLAIFLSPRSTVFKNAKWDNWRKDSSEWHNSIKPSGQESAPSTKQSTSHRF
ncbi:uncharacterized protein EMH_0044920 [Eimeria mitis]|uniref:Uncharacterized protein n=1 Tax=Eimeria mitis TaxID=44415 RepID=U6JTW8_9EIME|nr:uncharacterized protein EMH_0044920 [Eimeria mitis]CDJ28895.1 hypothetical protein, conserved [Eimeria mitis]